MKWFFYGLLAANAAFFAWIHFHPQNSVRPAVSTVAPTAGARLTLLRELPSPPPLRSPTTAPAATPATIPATARATAPATTIAARSVAKSAAAPAAARVSQCWRISGFESKESAGHAAHKLSRTGVQVRRRGSMKSETTRYWIILPPYRSVASARVALETLRKSGIKDYYLIRGGDDKNGISLGVYSGHDAARRRYREIQRLRLHPRIQEIAVPATTWWIEFERPHGKEERWRRALDMADRTLPLSACR